MKPLSFLFIVIWIFLGASPLLGTDEEKSPFFTDVAGETGLASHAGLRVAFADLNNDGFLDCVLRTHDSGLFLNQHGLRFEPAAEASNLDGPDGEGGKRPTALMIFGDVDDDGDLDAFSGIFCDFLKPGFEGDRSFRNAILLNNGKGVFSMNSESGVDAHPATICAATFLDYDHDGRLDLFVGNQYKQYPEIPAYQDRLYRGTGQGRFEEVTQKAGLATIDEPGHRNSSKPAFGAGHCDFNNDGYQDLLVCVYGRQWNFLWKNLGNGSFVDVAEATGFDGDEIRHGKYSDEVKKYFLDRYGEAREDEKPFRSNGNTFSVACADYDCDGDMDLFLGEITHGWAGESSDRSSLLINKGEAEGFAFERKPDAVSRTHADSGKWNQGDLHVGWIDFDNDGRQDLLIASGDYPDGQYLRLFRQQEDHRFQDITDACGFDWEGSGGLSIGDYDRDGDQDILVGKSWMRLRKERCIGEFAAPALFRNNVGNRNHWITIQLRGKGPGGSNGFGIGARVSIEAGGKVQIREIQGGCGHNGQFDPPEAHFGLGNLETIDRISVRWPNQELTLQRFEKVKADRLIRIAEEGGFEEVKFPR
ncbi:MAG: CRTAC1 family protein [Planctomycetota bacterium]